MRKIFFLPFFLFYVCSLISPCFAEPSNSFNFLDIPQRVSNALGIPLFASQLLVCGLVLFMFLLPCAIWSKGNPFPSIILGFILMAFFISVSWLPYWILFVIAMIIALMFAGKVKAWITGTGEE